MRVQNSNGPFPDRSLTFDKKLILSGNRKRLAQWFDHEAPKIFLKLKLHHQKNMATACSSAIGIIHYSFLETSLHCQILLPVTRWNANSVQQNERYWLTEEVQFCFMKMIWLHVARMTVQKLSDLGYGTLLHPPYCSHLLPIDYHFCKHLDNYLKTETHHAAKKIQKMDTKTSWCQTVRLLSYKLNNFTSRWMQYCNLQDSYFSKKDRHWVKFDGLN